MSRNERPENYNMGGLWYDANQDGNEPYIPRPRGCQKIEGIFQAGGKAMTEDDIVNCKCRMDDHCRFYPVDERRFDFCDNAIESNSCPKGYTDGKQEPLP